MSKECSLHFFGWYAVTVCFGLLFQKWLDSLKMVVLLAVSNLGFARRNSIVSGRGNHLITLVGAAGPAMFKDGQPKLADIMVNIIF